MPFSLFDVNSNKPAENRRKRLKIQLIQAITRYSSNSFVAHCQDASRQRPARQ